MTWFGLLFVFFLSLSSSPISQCWAGSANSAIRFYLPSASSSGAGGSGSGVNPAYNELDSILSEYSKAHPEVQIKIVRRGENFSSLRDLIAMYLAGDLPELALIESAESPAIESLKIAVPLKNGPKVLRPLAAGKTTLPFERTLPILVANENLLGKGIKLPSSWNELLSLTRKLSRNLKGAEYALALPLQGPRGLWLFESLTHQPLWQREAGGLKSNRDLSVPIRTFQHLLDLPGVSRPEETWDHAIQQFINRKVPLLVTSLDVLPQIRRQVTGFKWRAAPMPRFPKGFCVVESGTDLLVTKDSPEIWALIAHLYSPEIASRWSQAGGVLPLAPSWRVSPAFSTLIRPLRPLLQKTRPRTTDTEIVRARSAWIQTLHLLFGESSKRVPVETVFTQLDRLLISK